MESRVPVLICGGGVGGLALGIRLKQLGVSSVIIEKQRGIQPQVKGEYFQPRGVQVLRELGLLESFLEQSRRIRCLSHAFPKPVNLSVRPGTLRFRFSYESYDGIDYGLAIPHERILEILREEYRQLGGDLREGLHVRDLTDLGDRVAVDLSNGTAIEADFFIGADGKYSATRKLAGLEPIETPCERMMMAALVKGLTIRSDEFYSEEVPAGVLYAFRFADDTARVYVAFEKADFARANSDREAFFREALEAGTLPGRKKAELRGAVQIMPTLDVMLRKAHRGRALWFGDAAGSVDPLGGHGMAVALTDAMRIAEAIRSCWIEERTSSRIEAEFERLNRLSRREYLHARFVGLWIGNVMMHGSRLATFVKWRTLHRYRTDSSLRKRVMRLFAGVDREPFGIYDFPYLFGYFPGRRRNQLHRLPLSQAFIEEQNALITAPIRLVRTEVLNRLARQFQV